MRLPNTGAAADCVREKLEQCLRAGMLPTCVLCVEEFEWGGELRTEAAEAAESAIAQGWTRTSAGFVCPACDEELLS